jgi:hypothetical protein
MHLEAAAARLVVATPKKSHAASVTARVRPRITFRG